MAATIFAHYPQVNGYAEERRWATEIFRSENGTEARSDRMVGTRPQRVIRYPVKPASRAHMTRMLNLLTDAALDAVYVPLWFSRSRLIYATNDDPLIYCDTYAREFSLVDSLVLVSLDVWDGRTIVSILGSEITVDSAAPGFPAGAWAIPAIKATPGQSESVLWRLEHTGEADLTFEEMLA